jgi:fatty acid desaturase
VDYHKIILFALISDVFLTAERVIEMPVNASPTEYGLLPGSPDLRRLSNPQNGPWLEFRKNLRPNYPRAWFELFLCIALLFAGFVIHLYLAYTYGNAFGLKIGILFALWIGFWLNSVLTFGHEAAHYNLASDKNLNDLFSDWTIWLFFPQSTRSYRKSHWQHHLHLGDHEDTEISYHNCLSPLFLAKAIIALHLATLVVRYFFLKNPRHAPQNLVARSHSEKTPPAGSQPFDVVSVLRAIAIHTLFVSTALFLHCYSTAIVWLFAVIFLFPFFASVRQILEHRATPALCETDFMQELHGPINRMFGKDPFSRFFGAAGFNRHMLHHWDPTVSYTCFDKMQAFFAATELKPHLEDAQSTYLSSFTALLKTAIRNAR